ncbi:NAD(P)-binding protein [Favolaschia claudopus]|uniref:NAD(P)-binding protein n=1 Tax=Favolaschia claudopus TaxID=2862362 RepID=A0AAW0C332_9AGAR
MSTTIAIFGATGPLGKFVLQAIADSPQRRGTVKEIRILTRPQSVDKANTLARQYPMLSITVHPLSYGILPGGEETVTGSKEIEDALRTVDVVLSLVGDDSGLTGRSNDVKHVGLLPGFLAQDGIARAAKKAGVKLFVPSEFGAPTHSMSLDSDNYIVGKRIHHDLLRELELPCLLIYAGMFPEVEPSVTPLPAFTAEDPIPLGSPPFETTRYHVAAYIVELLLHRGVETVANTVHVIRGVRRDIALVSEAGRTEWVPDV